MKFFYFLIGILLSGLLIGCVQALDSQISCNGMTSNSSSTAVCTGPYTVNISSMESDLNTYNGWKAFDGVAGGATIGWSSKSSGVTMPQWIQQYIPGEKIATAYNISPYSSAAYRPSCWTFEASNDNFATAPVVLDTQSLQAFNTGIPNIYEFVNTDPYDYYRLNITYNNNSATTQTILPELLIYGTSASPIPVASFTPVSSQGVSPHAVAFTDTSTNTPTYWNWTIEGVGTNTTKYLNASTSQNPAFTFREGNFTISLGAGNEYGFDMSDQVSWVNASFGGPVVSFSTNVTSGVNPLGIYLNDTSTLSPTYWNTSWGNNDWTNQTSFPATNITHLYSTAGTYWINHYATNPYGTANGTPLLITVYGAANAQFSSFNTEGGAPFTTYLYDTSTNTTPGAVTYYWDFGDGNTSTEQNLFYTWNITGTYTVKHSMDNGVSINWSNQTDYVTVGTGVTAPVASFYGGPQIGAVPLNVFFTDISTNTPTSWLWDFGDGNTTGNTEQNPIHLYNRSGFFTINLTATNGAGSNSSVQSNYITIY